VLTAHEAGMHGGAGAWARERYGFSRVSEWSVCTSLTSITALSPQHSCRPTQEHMARRHATGHWPRRRHGRTPPLLLGAAVAGREVDAQQTHAKAAPPNLGLSPMEPPRAAAVHSRARRLAG